jgi:hypothetical protein
VANRLIDLLSLQFHFAKAFNKALAIDRIFIKVSLLVALLTTTMVEMKKTIHDLKQNGF